MLFSEGVTNDNFDNYKIPNSCRQKKKKKKQQDLRVFLLLVPFHISGTGSYSPGNSEARRQKALVQICNPMIPICNWLLSIRKILGRSIGVTGSGINQAYFWPPCRYRRLVHFLAPQFPDRYLLM